MPVDTPPAAEAPPADTIVIQAARLPPSPADAAFSITLITPSDMAGTPRLDQVIATSPGASLYRRVSSAGANPTTQGISLRSIAPSGAGRALVTLDGVPQNDPFGNWVIWSALPAKSISDVRLVRGAGAGPYGAGALTGVVSLDERTSVPGGIAGEASAGSRGGDSITAVGDANAGPVNLFAVGSDEQGDRWTPVRPPQRGAADTPLTLHDWNGAARAQTDLGPAVVALHVGAYEEDRDSGEVNAYSRARGQDASLTAAAAPTDQALGWRVQTWVRHSDLVNTSVSTAVGRNSDTPSDDEYATPATGWGVNAAVRKAGAWGDLELGADVRDATGEDRELFSYVNGAYAKRRLAGGESGVAGAYLEGARTWGGWLLTGGVRVDDWRTTQGHLIESLISTGAVTLNSPAAPKSGAEPTGRLGLRRDLGGGFYVRSAAYEGFRVPSLNELYRPYRVGNNITEANPDLKPEVLQGVEAAVGGAWPRGAWSATLFFNRLLDPVTNVTIGVGPGTFPIAGVVPAGGLLQMRENAGRIDAPGLELEGSFKLLPTLNLKSAASYTDAVVNGGAALPQDTGKMPIEAPKITATAGAYWDVLPRWQVSSNWRYESKRYDDDVNTLALAPALTWDLRTDVKVTEAIGVYLAVINVTDAAVVTQHAVDGTLSYDIPRTVRVGITLRR